MMKRFLVTLLLMCWVLFAYATVSIEIEPNRVALGETFRMTLTQDDTQSNALPDLIPLEQDFNIVGTERRMSYTVVNGQAKSFSQWSILLVAQKTGMLTIPAIKIGQQSSAPTQIEVTNAATSRTKSISKESEDVLLIGEASSTEPFLNEQVIYTVKLFNRRQLIDAVYQAPTVEDALLIPLGKGRHARTSLNGESYSIEEQKYAIFPQKSGTLVIHPPTLTALVYDEIPRQVKVKGKAIQLTVKPMPASSKTWLPAKQVSLTEQYDETGPTFLQGQTIERTINLEATAVPAQLLPKLTFKKNGAFNVYTGKPDIRNVFKNGELIGTSKIKVTYLLNKPGQIIIPELKVTWFNTLTGQEEISTLPEHTVTVDAKAGFISEKPKEYSAKIKQQTTLKVSKPSFQLTAWIVGTLLLAWMIPLLLWWLYKYAFATRRRHRLLMTQLRDACIKNNPTDARMLIMQWAVLHWPGHDFLTLNDVVSKVDDSELKKQLQRLSRVLYRQNERIHWTGKDLWHVIHHYKMTKKRIKIDKNGLPPINPR